LEKRQIIAIKAEELLPYNRYGKVSKGLKWLPLSKDENLEHEVFIIRFEADSSSNLHRHNGNEEFYMLEGELIDADGKVFKKDDWVGYCSLNTSSNRCVVVFSSHFSLSKQPNCERMFLEFI